MPAPHTQALFHLHLIPRTKFSINPYIIKKPKYQQTRDFFCLLNLWLFLYVLLIIRDLIYKFINHCNNTVFIIGIFVHIKKHNSPGFFFGKKCLF